MRRLSSALVPWWYKRIGLWCLGATAVLACGIILFFVFRGRLQPLWMLVPTALTLLGVAYIRAFVMPLADEVFDDGDVLVVRRGNDTTRHALHDITKVDYSLVFDPPRIVLHTRTGERIVFMPRINVGMCFFRQHPLVAELRSRGGA
jgi:hypothetical protein